MLGSIHVLPGADLSTGAIVLTVFVAGAMLALLAAFGVVAFRRAGESGLSGNLWRGGLIVVGIVLAWIVLDRSSIRDQMAERRSIETRAAELTVRAMAPGSALACLDAVAGATIETACEKALFASPEAVAAAVAYVDARFSLLASSIAVGQRDPAMRPAIERLRRAIEGDRFGLVAHVLMTRGCTSTDCPDLKLVRDTSRIMSNMRSRAFDALCQRACARLDSRWRDRQHAGRRLVHAGDTATSSRRGATEPARDGAATGDAAFDLGNAASAVHSAAAACRRSASHAGTAGSTGASQV